MVPGASGVSKSTSLRRYLYSILFSSSLHRERLLAQVHGGVLGEGRGRGGGGKRGEEQAAGEGHGYRVGGLSLRS